MDNTTFRYVNYGRPYLEHADEKLYKQVRFESGEPDRRYIYSGDADEIYLPNEHDQTPEDTPKKSMKEDFSKQALEYRKKFYNFHRDIEGYDSSVNGFASELKKQLTIKVKKLLDHQSLAAHFERQLYRLAKNPRLTRKNWSEDETLFLISLIAYYSYSKDIDYNNLGETAWRFVSEIYPGKKADQLRLRWLNVFKVTLSKAPWTPVEDETLVQIIKEKGAQHWKEIAAELATRSGTNVFRQGKQCRERWINHLDPAIKKGIWTDEEDIIILQSFVEFGKKWAEISKRLGGRTENSVKNRWISLLKRGRTENSIDNQSPDDDTGDDEAGEKKIALSMLNSAKYKDTGFFESALTNLRQATEDPQKSVPDTRTDVLQSDVAKKMPCRRVGETKTSNDSLKMLHPNLQQCEEEESDFEGLQLKKSKPSDLLRNLEGGEYSRPRTAQISNNSMPERQYEYLSQNMARKPISMPSKPAYSYPSQNYYQRVTPEVIFHGKESLDDQTQALRFDRRYFAQGTQQTGQGLIYSEMVDPRTRTLEQNYKSEYMGGFRPSEGFDYEDEKGFSVDRDCNLASTKNIYFSQSRPKDVYEEADENEEPHQYLLTEQALGTGKRLERLTELQPNPLYFALVNVQTKEIFFVDNATKSNYQKTLRAIKDDNPDDIANQGKKSNYS